MKEGHIGLGKIIFLAFLFTTMWLGYRVVAVDGDLEQDIVGYFRRAESATTAGGMAELLELGLEGLENYGLTEGNWSWVFSDNPDTEMAIAVGQFEALIVRLIAIEKDEDISSMDYATSLGEAKGSLDEINYSAYTLYTKKYASYLYPDWILVWGWGLPLLGFVIGLFVWDKALIPGDIKCRIYGHTWKRDDYDEWTESTNRYHKVKRWVCKKCFKSVRTKPEGEKIVEE